MVITNLHGKKFNNITDLAHYIKLRGNDISTPNTPGFEINKFGLNPDIDSAAEEDIWSGGGTRAFPGAAEQFNIASSSINDVDTTGSGAWTVSIDGLDANYDYQTETISLNGTSNVLTTKSFTNIHRGRIESSASSNTVANDGEITVTGATSSNLMADIPAGYGATHTSHFMIPAGYTGFLLDIELSGFRGTGGSAGTRDAEIKLRHKPFEKPPLLLNIIGVLSGTDEKVFATPSKFPEKSLIWFSAEVGVNNTGVTASYGLLCVKNEFCT